MTFIIPRQIASTMEILQKKVPIRKLINETKKELRSSWLEMTQQKYGYNYCSNNY